MIKCLSMGLVLIAIVFGNTTYAQGLPETDVWLVKIEKGITDKPLKLSDGNGYNNQPHFSADGSVVYYTREMPGDAEIAQTDIAAFHTDTSTTTMVNQTAESEYSPTPIPGRNAVSVIQVEPDQKQRLWAIDVETGEMELLLPHVEPVGYHAWINDFEIAMFVLGESFTLQTASIENNEIKLVADNIGRSIRKHPSTGEILFVDKTREPWQIAAYDHKTSELRGVMPLFPGGEDFTIDANGDYWTGNGSKLYRRSPGDKRWELVADFSGFGLGNISRLAINLKSQQIALVADKN